MLKLLIIDDEAPARARLRRMLARVPGCEVIGEAHSGDVALERLGELEPDALLLDISMPGLDGMSLARRLRDLDSAPAVIFCTAHPDQALEAFDCDAVDYLLKPVRQERLETALQKACAALGISGSGADVFLRSSVGSRTELIPIAQVVCLLAEDKYTTVYHDKGKTVINNTLVELEQEHGDLLLRVHRNALVMRARIRGLERHGAAVHLSLDGCEFRPVVSRRKLPEIRRIIRALT